MQTDNSQQDDNMTNDTDGATSIDPQTQTTSQQLEAVRSMLEARGIAIESIAVKEGSIAIHCDNASFFATQEAWRQIEHLTGERFRSLKIIRPKGYPATIPLGLPGF